MQSMGLMHFWSQADLVIRITAILLFLLSLSSWYVMLEKLIVQWRFSRSLENALSAFWAANTLPDALRTLRDTDHSGHFASLAVAGTQAADAFQAHQARGIGAGVDASEFITRAIRHAMTLAQARMERGQTFLASVGSTAPFIGLFGTVWGIYHALVGLSGATQVVLDKVAGPVGEALIMTAIGLFVAIPAVLAYNAFNRGNRLVSAHLDGFAHDLHAYLTTGCRMRANAQVIPPARGQ